jgi:peptide/nickel transport system substrate-binding protein
MRAHPTALLSIVLLAVACGDRSGDAPDSGGENGGTLVIVAPGTGSSPMLPPLAVDDKGRLIADNVFERLAEIGPDMNAVGDRGFTPRLARSWQWSADSLSVAFAIDPRARWHDGRPVTASDVRFTLRLLKDPKAATQYTSLLGNVDSVSVRDSLTAVAWFRRRTPEQFYDLAYQVYVLPEHVLKDIPSDKLATSDAALRPVGSGRFRLVRFEPGVRVELLADTSHYRGRPKLDRVILSFVADPGTAVTQLLNGQGDWYDNVPADVLPRVDSSTIVKTVPYTGLGYVFLGMNQRDPRRLTAPHPIFGDRRARLAISMSLDRPAMLSNVFGPRGVLGSGPFAKLLADTTIVLPPFDRARAGALLDSAGWRAGPDGGRTRNGQPFRFGILVPTSSPPRMRYAVLIQEQLKSIGVTADIESMDIAAFVERITTGKFDAVLNGTTSDPVRSGAKQVWASAGHPPAGQNYMRFTNRNFDALLDSAAANFDPARAGQYYHRAFQALVDDVPAVWLYDILNVAGAHKRIRPVGMRPYGWWAGLADWSIPVSERIDRDRIGLRPPPQP